MLTTDTALLITEYGRLKDYWQSASCNRAATELQQSCNILKYYWRSVSITAHQLFVEHLRELGSPPLYYTFSITEHQLLGSTTAHQLLVEHLRELGSPPLYCTLKTTR